MGNLLLKILVIEYVVIAVAYLLQKDYPRFLYFVGATILSVGILLIK